jgi:hypothetical protein
MTGRRFQVEWPDDQSRHGRRASVCCWGFYAAAQDDQGHVADCFDALAISEEHDFEQHGGRISGSTCFIMLEPGVEAGQIKLKLNEAIECVFKAARKQLPLQV